jgi:hypothetical protein
LRLLQQYLPIGDIRQQHSSAGSNAALNLLTIPH